MDLSSGVIPLDNVHCLRSERIAFCYETSVSPANKQYTKLLLVASVAQGTLYTHARGQGRGWTGPATIAATEATAATATARAGRKSRLPPPCAQRDADLPPSTTPSAVGDTADVRHPRNHVSAAFIPIFQPEDEAVEGEVLLAQAFGQKE